MSIWEARKLKHREDNTLPNRALIINQEFKGGLSDSGDLEKTLGFSRQIPLVLVNFKFWLASFITIIF